jgi:hypothetical protein
MIFKTNVHLVGSYSILSLMIHGTMNTKNLDEKFTVHISLISTFKSNNPKTNNRGTLGTKIGDKEYQKFQQQNIRRLCNYKTSQRDHLKSQRD